MSDLEKIEVALDQIAAWLVACYHQRAVSISLTLKGFRRGDAACWGIVPSAIRTDGDGRETGSSPELRAVAEGAFLSVFPTAVSPMRKAIVPEVPAERSP